MTGTKLSGTALVHADDGERRGGEPVAPSISVSTTFHSPEISDFPDPSNPEFHLYSRYTQDVSGRVEKVLGKVMNGWAITYSSGLAAVYSALVYTNPKRIAIGEGYFGTHGALNVYKKSRGTLPTISLEDKLQDGDLVWLESPLNPTGEAVNIKAYVERASFLAHAVGARVIVDATFGPPPLQDPYTCGADIIMHSSTKYLGGHSDLLGGVLVVKTKEEWVQLWENRSYTGNMMGSLEAWLLLRSLRTLHVRVPRQSGTATALAVWLANLASAPFGQTVDGVPGGLISKVWHPSLQEEPWVKEQMPGGFSATFMIALSKSEYAAKLPGSLKYFTQAASLGAVESLIERWCRANPKADPHWVRLSIGLEDFEDLKEDLAEGLRKLVHNE